MYFKNYFILISVCSHLSMATVSITLRDDSWQFMPHCVRWAWPTRECHVSSKTWWKTSSTTGWSSFAWWRCRDWIFFHTHLCVFIFLGTVTCSILAMETRFNVSLRFKNGAVIPHCPLDCSVWYALRVEHFASCTLEMVNDTSFGRLCSHRPCLILFFDFKKQ